MENVVHIELSYFMDLRRNTEARRKSRMYENECMYNVYVSYTMWDKIIIIIISLLDIIIHPACIWSCLEYIFDLLKQLLRENKNVESEPIVVVDSHSNECTTLDFIEMTISKTTLCFDKLEHVLKACGTCEAINLNQFKRTKINSKLREMSWLLIASWKTPSWYEDDEKQIMIPKYWIIDIRSKVLSQLNKLDTEENIIMNNVKWKVNKLFKQDIKTIMINIQYSHFYWSKDSNELLKQIIRKQNLLQK